MDLPKEFYYIAGILIVSNIGSILTIIKGVFEKQLELALMKVEISQNTKSIELLKEEIVELRLMLLRRK